MEIKLNVEGMMCGHCEARVRTALEEIPGVAHAEVSHEQGTAVVTLSAPVDRKLLEQAVRDAGYRVISR